MLLLFVLGLVAMIIFGAMVRNVALGHDRFGAPGEVAYAIASVPAEALNLFGAKDTHIMAVKNSGRFPGRAGWTLSETDTATTPNGYLLFSRYDGDAQHHVIEMLDLTSHKVAYRLALDADRFLSGAARDSKLADFSFSNTRKYRAIDPFALTGGDLIFEDQWSPLIRVNACGDLVWRLEINVYHHTTEVGADGNFWLTSAIEPTEIEGLSEDFFDDAIIQVSADGEVMYERSLTQVMMAAGLGNLLLSGSRFDVDPLHLNDVQPVLSDGKFWRAGDVFLSLRHSSMIILFRPGTGEIIWTKQGPWAAPHDVDIIDDQTIAVFNNNKFNLGRGEFVVGTSEILFYDFATDTVTSPY